MGEGMDAGAAMDMGGGEAAAGGAELGGGEAAAGAAGTEADPTGIDSSLATTGEGGSGGGMLSFAVSESMANQGAGTAPSTTGIAAPTTNVSGNATTPANAGAQAGTGDIIRKNPFGGDVNTPAKPNAPPELTGAQKAQKVIEAYQKGSKDSEYQVQPIQMSAGQGNTYAALFGSPNLMGRGNAPAAPPVPQIQAAPTPAAPMAMPPPVTPGGTGLPAPLQVQLPNPQPVPAPQLSVSDARAKQNIKYANTEMDQFLQRVYDNMSRKGKK